MPIIWPERYATERVAAHVSNEITIAAPPAAVWAWLIRAADWPAWYPNAANVRLPGAARDLEAGTNFTWRTFGVTVKSTVREFVPEQRIAWDGTALLLDVYHAWLIEPRAGGCWVLTEENQNGLAAVAQKMFMPNRMFGGHQVWLQKLRDKAEG
jgi:uncharacterized protein YndB with AHSA1/START domain